MTKEALCIGGPLDGKKHEVFPSAHLTVARPKAYPIATGELFPSTVIEIVQDTWLYKLENFRSRGSQGKVEDVLFYISNELSLHEAMLKLVEGYKP